MRFAIGYQEPENGEDFSAIIEDYLPYISEIYFAWPGTASGRGASGTCRGAVDWDYQRRLEQELIRIKKAGVKLDILFNANCYDERALSEHLEHEVVSILDYLSDVVGGVDIVTTTSLTVAMVVKKHFSDIELRASVNMKIGTINAMSYVSHLFDSFYIQRDYQRDIDYVKRVKAWCDQQGKKLLMLANSGCLHCCPGQTFHDNLVAHDAGIDEQKNIKGWTPHICWSLYKNHDSWPAFLQSTWVRPEDLHNYNELFPVVKLATRLHQHPRMVINAYTSRLYKGNLLDLFEPSYSPAFAPWSIDNTKLPDDFFEKTSTCGRQCESCQYCPQVLKRALVKQQEG